MESAAHSLSHLRDISLPEIPGLWPLTPGLWLLCILLLLPLFNQANTRMRQYRCNAYRRIGVQLLKNATSIDDLQIVLKRVALVAYPRHIVASLYGPGWFEFLENTAHDVSLSEIQSYPAKSPIPQHLRKEATRWIRHHQSEGTH